MNTFKSLLIFLTLFLGTAAMANPIVLALGDSLTDGYGLEKIKAYPYLLQNKLKKDHPEIKVINAGISGSTSAGALSRLRWFLKMKPHVLILSLGANDGLRGVPIQTTRKNLSETIQLAKDNQMKVLLAGMLLPPNYGKTYAKDFEQMYKDLAKEHKVELMPFLLKDVAGQPELNLPDGIHPNEKGHEIIAKNTLPYLKRLL